MGGALLLKRLRLEPWTAASSGKLQSEEGRVMKLEVSVLGIFGGESPSLQELLKLLRHLETDLDQI